MLLRVFSAALLAVAALASRPALAAEAKTSSLSWLRMPGADGCVATQPLARAIEERLGRAVFVSAAQADLSVEGRIEKRRAPKNGWRAVITVRDAHGATLGVRELERPDATCAAMTEPLALIVAVMIDPDAAMRSKAEPPPEVPAAPPPAPPPPAPERKPEPVPAPETPEAAPAPPPRADTWHVEGHAALTIHHGITPTLAPGAGVEAILYAPDLPIGLRGYASLFLPTEAEKDGARVAFDMAYGGASICPTLRGVAVNLLACLGGQLGILRPRAGTQNRGISEDILAVWNAMVELRAHIPIAAPFGMAAGVGAGLPLVRPEVQFTRTDATKGVDTLHRADAYVLTADVGIGFFFP